MALQISHSNTFLEFRKQTKVICQQFSPINLTMHLLFSLHNDSFSSNRTIKPQNIDFLSGRNVHTNILPCLSWVVSCYKMGWVLGGLGQVCWQDANISTKAQKHDVCKYVHMTVCTCTRDDMIKLSRDIVDPM